MEHRKIAFYIVCSLTPCTLLYFLSLFPSAALPFPASLGLSLGLISDACHMLFDCAALAIGLYASYIAKLDPPSKFAYG